MLIVAKIIHFLSFAIGIGGGVGAMVVGMRAAGAPDAAKPTLGRISTVIGRISFGAVILLWITGLYLVDAIHGGWSALGTLFWIKIAAVVALTACAVAMQATSIAALRAGTRPPAKRMAMLGMAGTLSAVTALVFAILAFG